MNCACTASLSNVIPKPHKGQQAAATGAQTLAGVERLNIRVLSKGLHTSMMSTAGGNTNLAAKARSRFDDIALRPI